MRQIRFTLWHIMLVIALVLGMISAVQAAAHTLLPRWSSPGLLTLLALVVLDATLTQRLVVQQRLSLSEQGTIRVVEVVLLVVAARITSLIAEGQPLLGLAQVWLRDPLAFFDGRFAEYAVAAALSWVVTTLLTQSVLELEAEPPHAVNNLMAIDEAALLQDRTLALARFDQLWLICVLLALAGAAVALRQVSLLGALAAWSTALPLLGVLMCVLAGLLLHSQGQLDQLQYGWRVQATSVEADVVRRWWRASWLLIAAALLLGLGLSSWLRIVPPPPLVPVINAILVVLTLLLAIVIGLFSLLLLPFAWLLSLFAGEAAPSWPQVPPIAPPQISVGPTERPLLPALIFWGCVVLLLGVALVRYVQQRQSLVALLGRWRGTRWLVRWLAESWQELESWGALALTTLRRRLRRRQRPPGRPQQPRGRSAHIRALYRRLVRVAGERGVAHPRSQTAYEFRRAAETALPPATDDIARLTEVYVRAEYGPTPPQPEDVRQARGAWRRIERVVARSGSRLRRATGKRPR